MKKPTAKRKAKTVKKKRPGKTKARKHTRKVAKKTIKKSKTAPLPLEYEMQEEWIGADCASAGKRMEGLYSNAPTPTGAGLRAS